MRFARWITEAADTHSEYVILTAFPRQQWLRERASMLGHTYTAQLVLYQRGCDWWNYDSREVMSHKMPVLLKKVKCKDALVSKRTSLHSPCTVPTLKVKGGLAVMRVTLYMRSITLQVPLTRYTRKKKGK